MADIEEHARSLEMRRMHVESIKLRLTRLMHQSADLIETGHKCVGISQRMLLDTLNCVETSSQLCKEMPQCGASRDHLVYKVRAGLL